MRSASSSSSAQYGADQARTKLLSAQGKQLLHRAFSGELLKVSAPVKPHYGATQRGHLNYNEFSVLSMDDDDEEEAASSAGEEEVAVAVMDSPVVRTSPRLRASSVMTSPSPRWTTVAPPARRAPKLSLGGSQIHSASVPPPPPPPRPATAYAGTSGGGWEEDDLSSLSMLTVNSKGQRSSHRTLHGNKPNQFKALQQRLYSQAKRDRQREASKPVPEHDDEYGSYDFE